MTTYALEKVLQYAYFNGYTCVQWADLVKQYMEQSEQDLSPVICDLLLKHFFSTSRVHSILLENYVAYALTGGPQQSSQGLVNEDAKALVQGKLFVSHLVNRDIRFASNREYSHQWSCILRLLPSVLIDVDGDRKEHLALAPMLTRLLVILSHIVAVGLYPHRQTASQRSRPLDNDGESDMESDNEDTTKQQKVDNNDELNFSLTNNTTQLGMDSQLTLDPDATLDVDATQPMDDKKSIPVQISTANTPPTTVPEGSVSGLGLSDMDTLLQQNPSTISSAVTTQQPDELYHSTARASSTLEKDSLEWENAISAAKLIIDLIEKKGLKRIIEKYNQGVKSDNGEDEKIDTIDPWVSCHRILMPDKATSALSTASSATKSTSLSIASTHNVYIQKLLLLVERLTDRDLERRLAVHMKYHELEDEGTARAMPSAGLMGLVYHMVQICPTLDDDELISRLVKLQAIKGSFDESFYLELWFAALTGLREASLSTSCQNITSKTSVNEEHPNQAAGVEICNTTVAANRLLWKNLVLVKLPHLIYCLQEQKKEEAARHSLNRGLYQKSTQSRKDDESNAIESSLMELKTFTGLLNACNPPACCPEFYVPSSKSFNLVNRFAFGGENDGSEEQQLSAAMDDMIDDSNYTTDFNTPTFIKAMQTISKDDIFTCILRSCRSYKSLRNNKSEGLTNGNSIKVEPNQNDLVKMERLDDDEHNQHKSLSSVSMDVDTTDRQDITSDAMAQVDQNIEQRMAAIQSNTTKASISELIHIGLVSLTHWRRIVEFLLKLLNEKAQAGDVRGLYRLCGALNDCPTAIDLVLQLHPPSALLTPLETICNTWNPSDDYMDVDDGASGNNDNDDDDDDDMDGIQNWYYKFGKIWIFVLVVASKFDIANVVGSIFKEKTGLCYQFFVTGPTIYGVHDHDQEVENLVGRWLSAMGGDGISDDLLRTTNLQMLLRGTPTIIDRLLCIYDAGRIETETFTEVLSYFRKRFLHFVLVPGVINVICDELLNRNASAALTSMTHLFLGPALPETLIGLCGNTVLGSLYAWMESQRQYKRLHGNKAAYPQQQIPEDQLSQMANLERFFITRLDVDDEHHLSFPETISNGVTRRTLTEKSREMFRYIVKSGRSMYMNNVDGDARNLWEPVANGKPPKQVVSHYLDLVMFQAALKMGGAHWFISMIVDEVLEAGKSGGAVRAAELGSCLLTTPLLYNGQPGGACLAMLRCLLQDVIPSSIKSCSTQNTSFFQGQTVGVFVSDCLVLMYQDQNDPVDKLGCQFFDALVIDRVRGGDVPPPQLVPQINDDGSRFALWDEQVVSSPVWRGFVKGLMSNPYIKEMWPNAYAS